jgi:hypothetical protein
VLRSSASVSYIGGRSDNSSNAGKPAAVAHNTAGKKPSPSPSVKRGKAEALLKEHGSPPGLRVTAGGRIVPSDLPPLGGPRYPYGSLKGHSSTRVSPALAFPTQSIPDFLKHPFGNAVVYDSIGQPCVYTHDQFIPLHAFDSYNAAFRTANHWLYPAMASTNGTNNPGGNASHLAVPALGMPDSRNASSTNLGMAPQPDSLLELPRLKKDMATKQAEHRYLEQTQVLERDHRDEEWNLNLVTKKKSLVTEIDLLRRQIKALEAKRSPATTPKRNGSYNPQYQQSAQPGYSEMIMPVAHMGPVHNGMFDGVPVLYPQQFNQTVMTTDGAQYPAHGSVSIAHDREHQMQEAATQSPPLPNSATRRSHAVEIKAPRDSSKLDPTSPTYEPKGSNAHGDNGVKPFGVPTPSPIPSPTPDPATAAKHAWLFNKNGSADQAEAMSNDSQPTVRYGDSISSATTADFFPVNTHEHSSTRTAPPKSAENMKASAGHDPAPTTPEKQWLNNPWHSGGGSGGAKSRLVLSNQVSPVNNRMSSFSQDLMGQMSNAGSRAPSHMGTPTASARASRAMNSGRLSASGTDWSPFKSTPVKHVPTTYQEGYQAGLIHKGLPASLEVIHGYSLGLAEVLRQPDVYLRGKAACNTDRHNRDPKRSAQGNGTDIGVEQRFDSAVSMSFPSEPCDEATSLTQENIRMTPRSAQRNGTDIGVDQRLDSAVSISFPSAQCDEATSLTQENVLMTSTTPLFSPNRDIWATAEHAFNSRTVSFCQSVIKLQEEAEQSLGLDGDSRAALHNNVAELQKQYRQDTAEHSFNSRTVSFCQRVVELQEEAEQSLGLDGDSRAALYNNIAELQKQYRQDTAEHPFNGRTVSFCQSVIDLQGQAERAPGLNGGSLAALYNNVAELQKLHRQESEREQRRGLSTITNIDQPLSEAEYVNGHLKQLQPAAEITTHHSLPHGFQMSSFNGAKFAGQQRVFHGRGESTPPTPQGENMKDAVGSGRRNDQRVSGLDGAMDDLAQMMGPVTITGANEDTTEASCFRSSNKAGKQKTTSSPTKGLASPNKAGKQSSPAKAGLENALNRVRSHKPTDKEKAKWHEDWRNKFRSIKEKERQEIAEYKRNNPLSD